MDVKILRILGKWGRITIPRQLRELLGIQRGDVISFSIASPDAVILKREKLCDNCKTVSHRTEPGLSELIGIARSYTYGDREAGGAFDSLTSLSPTQQFDSLAKIVAAWAKNSQSEANHEF